MHGIAKVHFFDWQWDFFTFAYKFGVLQDLVASDIGGHKVPVQLLNLSENYYMYIHLK